MFIEDTLKELSIILRVSPFTLLILLATVEFLAMGSLLSLAVGTRRMFVFGVIPLVVGTLLGIFPLYFVMVGFVLGLCISCISFPRSISYEDRVRIVEVEMEMERITRG